MIAIVIFCSQLVFAQSADTLLYPEETHFRNIQQLTFGGDNAEAYWSYDGKRVVFQRTSIKDGVPCDQIFMGQLPQNGEPFRYKMVSPGKGRTTCAFFTSDNTHIIYASTHLGADTCPPPVDRAKWGNRYIWPLYDSYDIFIADTSGKNTRRLTNTPGYDAEATLSPDGKQMVFTSVRDGDLDLYVLNLASGKTKRITTALGYDGGAWFSPDGKQLVWRASRPKTPEEIKEYKELLKQGLVAPTKMEVFLANADGSNAKQITFLGQANWAPNFMPDGRIIFCSNHEYQRGFPFNMYTINTDGINLQKVSRDKGFDAFPMFSPDGKRILFASNRNNGGTRETNLFVADWVEGN
ncbi:WD40-like Beta Propeller Repeat [Cnuella takakiae]|uniref:WD40-like Beta Propeller Repeat n=1 Tax=Cnuella takakiae TaxID=1302690 RepID=A0A1M5B563_9BACT|nr:WD40-like Beta Propeller Repeat [Cnuella takakiae]